MIKKYLLSPTLICKEWGLQARAINALHCICVSGYYYYYYYYYNYNCCYCCSYLTPLVVSVVTYPQVIKQFSKALGV